MPDYQKAKIYKLWSPQGEEDEVYYGSTCNDLRFRKSEHKNKRNCSSKILFEKYDDVRIELVEDYPCNNKAELNKKEGHYIRENKCLNKQIAGRTKKEWNEDNKEKITKQTKEYYEDNKEKILESAKEYRENNKEHIAQHKKEYYLNNKERVTEYNKEYYLKKKEKNKL
jgi:hypothetical protein